MLRGGMGVVLRGGIDVVRIGNGVVLRERGSGGKWRAGDFCGLGATRRDKSIWAVRASH